MSNDIILQSDCILDCNPITTVTTQVIPVSMCPSCVVTPILLPITTETTINHCLDSYLYNLVTVKNCSTMPTGCK